MRPTLYEGDKIAVDEQYYADHVLQDGDVILIRHGEKLISKRVLALPGESIEGRNGVVLRNGHALAESYITPFTGKGPPELATFAGRPLGKDEIFVIGDNREASLDSRMNEFGPVSISDVVGKVIYVYASNHGGARRVF